MSIAYGPERTAYHLFVYSLTYLSWINLYGLQGKALRKMTQVTVIQNNEDKNIYHEIYFLSTLVDPKNARVRLPYKRQATAEKSHSF